MKKRIISLILVLCSLLTLLPLGVSAEQVPVTDSGSRVNPFYGGQAPDMQIASPVIPRSVTYITEDEAVDYFRTQLEARASTVTIHYTTTRDVKESANSLFDQAVLHTGEPTQGDYLYYQWGGYSWKSSTIPGTVKKVSLTYQVDYYTTAQQEQELDRTITGVLSELNLWNAPDYEKITGIYDYICDHVVYDYANLGNNDYKLQYTAYAAMVQGTSVCQGYALLFYRMALELGVDTRLITGIGNGGRHGWNIVRIGGLYYNVDATWDAGETVYDYFLRSPDNFDDHYRDDKFETADYHATYPMSRTDFVFSAVTPLAITQQPKSVTAASGATARVTLKAQGEGLTYRWYFANKGESAFSYTGSFKGNSYAVAMNDSRNGRRIYCEITDKYGKTIRSNTVTLTMGSALKITTQPVSVAVASGKTAKVTVGVTGEGLTYKWYYRNKGASAFAYTGSFKGNSYSVAMNNARDGRQIYCVITDKYGNSLRTNTVTLSKKTPLKITTQPVSVTVAAGAQAKVTVKAQGDGLTYAWYYADPTSGVFQKTNAFKSNSYNVAMNASRAGRIVYCVVTDKYGQSVQTNMVVLNQTSALKITAQPTSVTVAAGAQAKVTVGTSGQGLTFKWYYADAGSSTFKRTTAFRSSTYAVAMTAARAGRRVYCVITDKYGNIMVSNVVTLNKK